MAATRSRVAVSMFERLVLASLYWANAKLTLETTRKDTTIAISEWPENKFRGRPKMLPWCKSALSVESMNLSGTNLSLSSWNPNRSTFHASSIEPTKWSKHWPHNVSIHEAKRIHVSEILLPNGFASCTRRCIPRPSLSFLSLHFWNVALFGLRKWMGKKSEEESGRNTATLELGLLL